MFDPQVNALLNEIGRLHGETQGEAYEPGAELATRRVLGMQVADELYGVPIEHINEISKLTPVTYVPGAPEYILGVTSLRGQIVPVINLRAVLSLEAGERPAQRPAGAGLLGNLQAKPRIVVVHHNEQVVGLLVDTVTEVYDLRGPLEPALGTAGRGHQIKEGQISLEERILIVLHVPALFMQLAGT